MYRDIQAIMCYNKRGEGRKEGKKEEGYRNCLQKYEDWKVSLYKFNNNFHFVSGQLYD